MQLLAEVAERYSLPVVALGAETAREPGLEEGSILVRFDLMHGFKLPESDELWVEAEPGVPWLELDNNLHARGEGLVVYPTSAPRATVGGWLALDGLGVGSFEYGWLSENVLSADVVLPGGERREVPGEDLRAFVGEEGGRGIVVGARLKTRRVEGDLPFGIAFESPEALAEAVTGAFRSNAPLWHLAFLNPQMALARGHGDRHLLFGPTCTSARRRSRRRWRTCRRCGADGYFLRATRTASGTRDSTRSSPLNRPHTWTGDSPLCRR